MKKRLLGALLLALAAVLLIYRPSITRPVEFTTFAMDTVMSFTIYEDRHQGCRDSIIRKLAELEEKLSVTREGSEIFRVNRWAGQPVEVESCAALLEQALELCEVTGGALDITAYPAVKAWGFTTGEHRVPGQGELAELAARIDYSAVKLEGNLVTLPAGMELDLGAVAKGWAGDELVRMLRMTPFDAAALLNLGQSTIVAVGSKPGGKPWRVAIQDPAGEGAVGVVELIDCAMGTSGGYQRFFEQDGEVYWHILDPKTAAPARSGLASVTVVSPSALVCDGLSTALFVMGLEEGARFWQDHPELEFEAVFVTEEGEVFCTKGLADRFVPENREVTLLE